MRVLVTGSKGYVGSRLCPYLKDIGFEVNEFGGDIRNDATVADNIYGGRINAIIHLAAISNDPTGEVDEVITRQTNFEAVELLLSHAKLMGVNRFINASSSSVYGVKREEKVTEAVEPEPVTFYSKYKFFAEFLVKSAASSDFTTVNVRPATICGWSPRQRFDLTVNKMTADAVRNHVITVHGGEQRRPNIGMTDMIRLYGQLLIEDIEKINGQTFNFGYENMKVIDIAKLIQSTFSDLPIQIKVEDTKDLRDYHIDSFKIGDRLGVFPKSSIRDEIRELRARLEMGHYPNHNDAEYYNMRHMRRQRMSPYGN